MSFKKYVLYLKLLEVVPKNHEEQGGKNKRGDRVLLS